MLFGVHCEVVAAGEGALTVKTLERSVAGVFAIVTRQFVGPGEAPATAGPRALVWSLARVCPHVNAKVRRLGVLLGAAVVRTDVLRRDGRSASSPARSTSPGAWSACCDLRGTSI